MDKKTGRAGTPNTKHDGRKPSEVKSDQAKPSGKNRQKRSKSDAKPEPRTEPETVVDFPAADLVGEFADVTEPEPEPPEERIRPGVLNETLDDLGIRHVDAEEAHRLCGIRASGLWIPYTESGGYGRLRLDNATPGQKYHQAKGSTVNVYLTPELGEAAADPQSGVEVAVIEGEFKSLALSELGIPAVGLGGFYGFRRKDRRLVPELKAMLDRIKPRAIYFCGDSDTSLNEQFADAALQLAALVDCPVLLPRLHLDEPKGWDDVREACDLDDERFLERWREAAEEAVPVHTGKTTAKLAVELLRAEKKHLKAGKHGGLGEWKAKERLVEIGAMAKRESDALMDEVADLVVEAKLFRRSSFKSEVNKLTESRKESAKEKGGEEEFTDEMADAIVAQFYCGPRGSYFREQDGVFLPIPSRADMLDLLAEMGVPNVAKRGEPNPKTKSILLRIQTERAVDFIGPLCGRRAGYWEDNGVRGLATTSPNLIEGAAEATSRDGPMFRLVNDLLRQDPTQVSLFLGWLQRARQAIRDPEHSLPGQAVGFIGKRGCGKTLMQDLVTQCLGGRDADAGPYLTGEEAKNTASLFSAEHLVVSDENVRSGPSIERFRDRLKAVVARSKFRLRAMYKDAIQLRPVWRVTLSANDDLASLGAVPNPGMDESLEDKVILFSCGKPDWLPGDSPQERHDFWESLMADLPQFLAWVDQFRLPPDLRDQRFGVKAYIHPDLEKLLAAADPDAEALELVAHFLLSKKPVDGREWKFVGTADELLRAIREAFGHTASVDRALSSRQRMSGVLERMQRRRRWRDLVTWEMGLTETRNDAKIYTIRYE